MELALGIITLLGSALGLFMWYAKKKDVNEETRQEKINELEAKLIKANSDGDYTAMRNLTRKLNRLRK